MSAMASNSHNVLGAGCGSERQSPALLWGWGTSLCQGRVCLHYQRKTIQLCEIFQGFEIIIYFFFGPPWSRISIKKNKKKLKNHACERQNCVRTSVFSLMLLFRCLLLSCLRWPADIRVQEFGQRKTCLKLLCLVHKNAPGFTWMVHFNKSKFSQNALTTSRLFSVAPGTAGKTETSWQNYTTEIAGRRAQFNTH